MKEEVENMTAYIRYRLEKAQEVYEAARILCEAGQWNSAVNRLYYACFYSASALLLYLHLSAKSHAGVIGQFFRACRTSGAYINGRFSGLRKVVELAF